MKSKKLKIMVSSTVYGIEDLLERIYTLLIAFGYEVWMSHKGTIPVHSNKSNVDNCLDAVEQCDLFLGIITTYYGSSGHDRSELSITHQEMIKAIELKKPRWLLVHDHVVFGRQFLKDLGYHKKIDRATLQLQEKATSLSDLRLIDLYEEVTQNEINFTERQGNWVQKYKSVEDAATFAVAQFSRYIEVEEFIKENFQDTKKVIKFTKNGGEKNE